MILSYWIVLNEQNDITGPYLMDVISCDLNSKVRFKHFWLSPIGPCSINYVSHWTVPDKYYISGQYLMDLISCHLLRKSVLNILDCVLLLHRCYIRTIFEGPDFMILFSKVCNWTVLNKYFISGPYFMESISNAFF